MFNGEQLDEESKKTKVRFWFIDFFSIYYSSNLHYSLERKSKRAAHGLDESVDDIFDAVPEIPQRWYERLHEIIIDFLYHISIKIIRF